MTTEKQTSYLIVTDIAFPDVIVKTHHGNVHFKSLIQDKRIIVYTNPSELIPDSESKANELVNALRKLKKLNYHLIGFNRNSFEEHLKSLNWLNSYLSEDLVFPVFYQPQNNVKECLEKNLGEKITLKSPIYLLDKNGCTRMILDGSHSASENLETMLEQASKLVLADQSFGKNQSLRDS
ncbi:redoxin domain-containing protein [Cyclobacterium jeungdonense]|uniref:Redoxin domain-containing protein n=1 Tax=Cyclobacterium jeungdonense TaxID=708087 RepID=A0ABT8C7P1_9BACT|nr:redoxin domain-containing protein [Cyclobacterium jeungdonense]MDN3688824.1 redoxin domain-containing protein [Cyclobacterium jeungdonense]